MRRLVLLAALAACLTAQAADLPYGRLFYTAQQRAALEDARRRNIRAEELAAEAAKQQPKKPPGPRKVAVTGIVQRSDGGSVAWINGKPVESETKDGLRVRHGAGSTGVVVYDPEKRRTVAVKVGQQVDLNTGRIEESYETRRAAARAAAQQEAEGATGAPPARKDAAKPASERSAASHGGEAASGKSAPNDGGEAPSGKSAVADDETGAGEDKRAAQADSDADAATQGEPSVEGAKQGG